jgi:sec-independent protein translocase protein TatC
VLQPIIDRRNHESVMGLGEHLDELRRRVQLALLGLLPILIIATVYGWSLVKLMLDPVRKALHEQGRVDGVQVTSAMETFSAYFYVVVLATLVVGGPWIVYQTWKFVAPGLYSNERRFAYVLAPLSLLLAVLGVLVMYFGMLPVALAFLISFGADQFQPNIARAPTPPGLNLPSIPTLNTDPTNPAPGQFWLNTDLRQLRFAIPLPKPATNSPAPTNSATPPGAAAAPTSAASVDGTAPSATAPPAAAEPAVDIFALQLTKPSGIDVHLKLDSYVDLFVNLALVFAIAFQVPVVMLLLSWAGIVDAKLLARYRKHAFAGSVIIGAVVSPTGDPISLAILQVPLYLLFELGMVLMRIITVERIAGSRPGSPAQQHADEGPMGDGP